MVDIDIRRPTHQQYAGHLLTAKEAASILRVDPETIRRWIREGVLAGIELPGAHRHMRRVKGEAVDKLLGNSAE